jgi:starch synthase
LAAISLGQLLIYFNAYVITEVTKTLCMRCGKPFEEIMNSSAKLRSFFNLSRELTVLHKTLQSGKFTKDIFNKYEVILADRNSKKSNVILELQRYLFFAQIQHDKTSLHYLEKLLIQLLGHYDYNIRDKAIISLNILYDGVDWQFGAAFDPKVTSVGSIFVIEETIKSKTPLNYAVLLLSAPSLYKDSIDTVITWHPIEVKAVNSEKGEYLVKVKLKKFWRCGFYDWKLVEVNKNGKVVILKKVPSEGETFAQGRFIVHPEGISEEQVHEVVVDYKRQDEMNEKNFYTLAEEIPKYAKMGINCLYLMGALERDNGIEIDEETGEFLEIKRPFASPLAIIDRTTVSKMLGGDVGYSKVIKAARKANVKLLVDCIARVSSSRPHRKYLKIFLHTLDSEGRTTLCYGTDGRSVNYEDTAILNYRKLKAWEMLLEDTITLVEKYKLNGIHLDNAQTWPVILELDEEELYRKDPDGSSAYTNKEILNGEIVKQCEGQGYWDSTSLDRYPNPIFIKLCRSLWARFPDFLIIGECLGGTLLENRQAILARSGVIPRLFKLPVALASIFGKKLFKDGRVISCKPENVSVLKSWYESSRRFTPEGSFLVQS